jgi:hypothetical protein
MQRMATMQEPLLQCKKMDRLAAGVVGMIRQMVKLEQSCRLLLKLWGTCACERDMHM